MDAPEHLILIDIDGLRPDVLLQAIDEGRLPNITRFLGGSERFLRVEALAPAPSITFASQACLFTGAHPRQHGVPGNQFFDRFGAQSHGVPRHYAFDIGDTLAADDAVRVFSDSLAARCLQVPTLYEKLGQRGWKSVVASHMYATGADTWLPPSLVDLARLTKGGHLLGIGPGEFDRRTLQNALEYLDHHDLPEVITLYFMGVDHESHRLGPQAQAGYLCEALDPLVGRLWEVVGEKEKGSIQIATAVFSDHGQIGVPADDRHSLRLAFPFEREIGHLFDALGLDVHDFPGEDPNCDAVVASNGGMAHVYLQNRRARWADPPDFERDILPVAQAFWEAHSSGRYATELEGALAGVLVRNVERNGWQAGYQALTPQGEMVSLEDWFRSQPADLYADPVHRLDNLAGERSGDLLLISNYEQGFYFGGIHAGVHGGLHPQDSNATMVFGWPGCSQETWDQASRAILAAITARCQEEGGRRPATADLLTGLSALIG
jgi:hypothetical protein